MSFYCTLDISNPLQGSYGVSLKGNHGFDNKHSDMKTTFIARGPDFKCGYKQETMRSVDVYPLVCKVLKLSSCHESRGVLERVSPLINTDGNCKTVDNGSAKLSASFALYISLALIALF